MSCTPSNNNCPIRELYSKPKQGEHLIIPFMSTYHKDDTLVKMQTLQLLNHQPDKNKQSGEDEKLVRKQFNRVFSIHHRAQNNDFWSLIIAQFCVQKCGLYPFSQL